MTPAAALPQGLSDAVTIVSGCSLLMGSLAWVGGRIWMFVSQRDVDLERLVLDGVGLGALIGIALALIYLVV
jgi:hypothetical protein